MSFVRCKTINNSKYAYQITSYRDPVTQKKKQKSKYLGIMLPDGKIIKKNLPKEKFILDFGDYFLLHEFIKQIGIYNIITEQSEEIGVEILPLLFYRLCNRSAMYNYKIWYDSSAVKLFFPKVDLSSQDISRILKLLGQDIIQKKFFQKYLSFDNTGASVIIDATSLPHNGSSELNEWGKCNSNIDKQLRLLFVIEQKTQRPLFFRTIPGNIIDISTLQNTIFELMKFGVKNSFVLLDAGYCSEDNILDLYSKNINFLTRMPATRKIYKHLIKNESKDIESIHFLIQTNDRALFIKRVEIELYSKKAFAYIILDPERKTKEIKKLSIALKDYNDDDKDQLEYKFLCSGIMILISSHPIKTNDVITTYYLRQSVEQVFGFFKSDLDSLPIRRHSTDAINGYLFLQFVTLILFLDLRQKLQLKYTVEQALLITRNLKCKVYDSEILISELSKKQKEIYDLCKIVVPKNCGI